MAKENKTAVTQLFDIIKGVAQYSEDNPFINQILLSEKRLLELEKQQIIKAHLHGVIHQFDNPNSASEDYYNSTYGGDND